jgi:hypothetical protein
MKKSSTFAFALIALFFSFFAHLALAQAENLSDGRQFGIGIRYLPNFLFPSGPIDTDLSIGTVITGQLWLSETVALEAGGWMSGFQDQWSFRSYTNMMAGMIFRAYDSAQIDFYVAGRGMRAEGINRNPGYCCYRCPECALDGKTPPPSSTSTEKESTGDSTDIIKPWPGGYENRTSTLAFEGVAGMEWSLSPNMVWDFEFGLIFAQIMGLNLPPNPEEKPTTFSSTSYGISMHIGFYYYFVPMGAK